MAVKWRVMTCAALLATTPDWARPVPELFAPHPLTDKLVRRRHLSLIGLCGMSPKLTIILDLKTEFQ